MSPNSRTINLLIHVRAAEDTGVEELAELVGQLSEELLELGAKAVSPVHAAEILKKGRIGNPIVLSDLLVTLHDSHEALVKLIEAVGDWATRYEQCIGDLQIRQTPNPHSPDDRGSRQSPHHPAR